MARKNKSLAGAFTQFQDPEEENAIKKSNQQSEQETSDVTELNNHDDVSENEIMNSNTKGIKKDVTQEHNTDDKTSFSHSNTQTEATQENGSVFLKQESSSKTVRDVKNNIMSMYDEKSKRKTVEETHTRTTFLFDNELKKRLDKLAKNKRGFKTHFINSAIEALLDEMEDVQK
ncbi:hypothetical protein GLW00_19730 [Halobacillus litoralis]|uniref:Uncharacterized protein n=1 Tax=Halobacillus litoralis TaxID=45668 RepID=A0A845FGW2_9BACI|nr:hypothetical protein [Halobacillus litoralis]MYL73049.1 hypothetical protein [Halobacillus litoralis]